ncbi:DUF433 domain-containing protein [Candidatus Poriferisodalis sp.]|uniref:DUF433 domain-containing protein n=1 Tax=Candidatus Poriferisodalis sp. TaxID=3101277 RepID=UPI003B0165B0
MNEGIYSVRQATNIVSRNRNISERHVRRWLVVVRSPEKHRHGSATINFLDLIGLEMACRFRSEVGASLQRVRKVLEAMHRRFSELKHPLAQESFFTDGQSVWIDFEGHLEEIVGDQRGQIAVKSAIRTFAEEIQFIDGQASVWDISEWIEINPRICFGEPVISGTRIPVSSIVACLEIDSPEEVARGFEISVKRVEACAKFAQLPT